MRHLQIGQPGWRGRHHIGAGLQPQTGCRIPPVQGRLVSGTIHQFSGVFGPPHRPGHVVHSLPVCGAQRHQIARAKHGRLVVDGAGASVQPEVPPPECVVALEEKAVHRVADVHRGRGVLRPVLVTMVLRRRDFGKPGQFRLAHRLDRVVLRVGVIPDDAALRPHLSSSATSTSRASAMRWSVAVRGPPADLK